MKRSSITCGNPPCAHSPPPFSRWPSGAIAHEINQPLTAIANYANASLRLLRAGNLTLEETADTMQRLATEAERAGAVVRKMRGFVRSEEGHLQAIGVDELFADVLRLTRAEAAQYEVEVSASGAGDLPKVLADAIHDLVLQARIAEELTMRPEDGRLVFADLLADAGDRVVEFARNRCQGALKTPQFAWGASRVQGVGFVVR